MCAAEVGLPRPQPVPSAAGHSRLDASRLSGFRPLGSLVDGPGSEPSSALGPTSSRAISRPTIGPDSRFGWWGYVDLNHGPLPYQGSSATGATCCDPGRQADQSVREWP
jgi:hypothetical protein